MRPCHFRCWTSWKQKLTLFLYWTKLQLSCCGISYLRYVNAERSSKITPEPNKRSIGSKLNVSAWRSEDSRSKSKLKLVKSWIRSRLYDKCKELSMEFSHYLINQIWITRGQWTRLRLEVSWFRRWCRKSNLTESVLLGSLLNMSLLPVIKLEAWLKTREGDAIRVEMKLESLIKKLHVHGRTKCFEGKGASSLEMKRWPQETQGGISLSTDNCLAG